MNKEAVQFLAADNVVPLVRGFYDYGAFFMAVFLLLCAVFFFVVKNNKVGGFFLVPALVVTALGIYIYQNRPQVYAHAIDIEYVTPDGPEFRDRTPTIHSSDKRLWLTSSVAQQHAEAGRRRNQWFLLVVDKKEITLRPQFQVRAGIPDPSSVETIRYDDVTGEIKNVGKDASKKTICNLEVQSFETQGPGDTKPLFSMKCRQDEAAIKTEARFAWLHLIGSAFAQPQTKPQSQSALEAVSPNLNSIAVVWYAKEGEGNSIPTALHKAEVNIVRRESNLPLETNAVWVGSDVDREIAKRVGKALIAEGIQLRYFGAYANPLVKINQIEIGASTQSQSLPPLTEKDIDAAQVGVPAFCYAPLVSGRAASEREIADSWRVWALSPSYPSRNSLLKELEIYQFYDVVSKLPAEQTGHGFYSFKGSYVYAFVNGRDFLRLPSPPKDFLDKMGRGRGVLESNTPVNDTIDKPTGFRFINERGMLQLVERGEVRLCQS